MKPLCSCELQVSVLRKYVMYAVVRKVMLLTLFAPRAVCLASFPTPESPDQTPKEKKSVRKQ